MSLLQDSIVYIWFVPVVVQIIIPLTMLIGWSAKKALNALNSKRSVPMEMTDGELKPVGSSA